MKRDFSLGEIAAYLDAELHGEPDLRVRALNTLQDAQAGELAFLANEKYVAHLGESRAEAVILSQKHAVVLMSGATVKNYKGALLIVANPYLGYAKISAWFDRSPQPSAGIHPTAIIDATANVGENVSIAANAVIDADVVIGAGYTIGAGCFIGARSVIGQGAHISANVSIYHDVRIGRNSRIHSGSVIGADGFGFAPNGAGGWQKIHQIGGVQIGDNVEVGACTTIDRGALGDTCIGNGVILDNHVQIAHNVVLGDNSAMAAYSAIAGSSTVGRNCIFAGDAAVVGHLTLCDGVTITARSLVTKSITEPGSYSSGTPLMPTREWRKNAVRMSHLDDLAGRVKSLEKDKG